MHSTQSPARDFLAMIGGEMLSADRWIEDLEPSTGTVFARFPRCGKAEIDQAVEAASSACRQWSRNGAGFRGSLLRRLAGAVRSNGEELVDLESRDVGKPLSQARAEIELSAHTLEFYADLASSPQGLTIPLGPQFFAYTVREPYGVSGHIVPWNYPLALTCRTIAPALLVGNCSVVKPAEEAPLSVLRLAELALEVGFPTGTLNVVPGYGDEAGAALAAHPGIGHLSFTGSNEVGKLVGLAAAENFVPVVLELGGKSPNIIFSDADLDKALPSVSRGIIYNAGQTCSAGSRLLVEESVHSAVVEALANHFASLSVGPGSDDPDLGPLISSAQLQRVFSLVEQGKSDATLVVGGDKPQGERLDGGNFILPTIFDDVPPESQISREEVFGPVLAVSEFSGTEGALEIAESTEFGLVAGVWTRDIYKAQWLARELQCGQVLVNNFNASAIELPFGGYKRSGHGREKGLEALTEYSQSKTVSLGLFDPPFPDPAQSV